MSRQIKVTMISDRLHGSPY